MTKAIIIQHTIIIGYASGGVFDVRESWVAAGPAAAKDPPKPSTDIACGMSRGSMYAINMQMGTAQASTDQPSATLAIVFNMPPPGLRTTDFSLATGQGGQGSNVTAVAPYLSNSIYIMQVWHFTVCCMPLHPCVMMRWLQDIRDVLQGTARCMIMAPTDQMYRNVDCYCVQM